MTKNVKQWSTTQTSQFKGLVLFFPNAWHNSDASFSVSASFINLLWPTEDWDILFNTNGKMLAVISKHTVCIWQLPVLELVEF